MKSVSIRCMHVHWHIQISSPDHKRKAVHMKRIYFIYNLKSGKGTIRSKLGDVIDLCTKAGYEVTARSTQSRMDACTVAEYACLQNYDMIACSGGDGTLNEVVHGVMNSGMSVPIGYIPSGSTNDFSRGLGIPRGIVNAAGWMLQGGRYVCDVGQFNDKYFMYVAAFGALVSVTYETPQQTKNVLGHAAYILNGITRLNTIRSYHMRVEYDGKCIEDDFIFGMVTNSASVAGMISLENFLLDDGVYEVTLVKTPRNPLDLHKIVNSLLNIKEDLDTRQIKCFRASRIRFTSAEPVPWTVDGECGGDVTQAEVINLKRAVTFAVGQQSNPEGT